ncbi:proline racemase family protein [uncultured Shimia sp.]|uniref:proline racemase family protein n=1 Tax=uncultured Shimia sp. TaxID=573152 RepID=UPI00260459F3|nr:proline racemase family protein [uncultured Shimia sp.]
MRAKVADIEICGDTFRVVLEGAPQLQAVTPQNVLAELRAKHEDFRHFLLDPPRGHRDVNACLLLPPVSEVALSTLVVAAQFGYAPVAGTMLMAASTALIETGALTPDNPGQVRFDTAAGPQHVSIVNRDAESPQTIWHTPAPTLCVAHGDLALDGRSVPVSLVHSGLVYVVVSASDLGLSMQDHTALSQAGCTVSAAALEAFPVAEHGLAEVGEAYLVMIVGEMERQGPSAEVNVAWVSGSGLVANSAGGTGAVAVAAHVTASGQLDVGAPLIARAPGGPFECRLFKDRAEVAATPKLIALKELI